jgi:hypothetical protein
MARKSSNTGPRLNSVGECWVSEAETQSRMILLHVSFRNNEKKLTGGDDESMGEGHAENDVNQTLNLAFL